MADMRGIDLNLLIVLDALLDERSVTRAAARLGYTQPSDQLDRQGEHVADAALCPDDAGRARIAFQLAPQPQDLHVDAAVEDIFMNAGRLKQILAAEKSLRRVEKGD